MGTMIMIYQNNINILQASAIDLQECGELFKKKVAQRCLLLTISGYIVGAVSSLLWWQVLWLKRSKTPPAII